MRAPLPTRVSVIIPTRDRVDYLVGALASVRALEGADLELEVIVADNGSSADSPAAARAFGAVFVRTLVPGAAAARNAGLRVATGDYVAFLDDDDVWLPGHLRPHLALLERCPEFAAAVGQVVITDDRLVERSEPWPSQLPTDGDLFDAFLGLMPQIGATVVRRSVLNSVGYLDEDLLSDEDWDWHLRLAARYPIGFVPVPCTLFRQRRSATADELFWRRWPYTRRVLLSNVRRAAATRRIPVHRILSSYLQHAGQLASVFLASAATHSELGERRAARRTLLWALRVSPVHVLTTLVRDARSRSALTFALL